MTASPGRPTVRLHDVSVSGTDDPDAVLAAVRRAVAATAAEGPPSPDAVRTAVASSVASSMASSIAQRSRP